MDEVCLLSSVVLKEQLEHREKVGVPILNHGETSAESQSFAERWENLKDPRILCHPNIEEKKNSAETTFSRVIPRRVGIRRTP